VNVFKNRWALIWIISASVITMILAMAYYLKQSGETDKKVLALIELGHSHFVRGETERAFEQYRQAWALKPKITSPNERNSAVNLAQIHMTKNDNAKAKDLLLKAVEYDPFFYAAYLFLGDISLTEKDAEKAIFYLEKGLSRKDYFMKDDPNAALLYYNMAEAYLMKNNSGFAKKNLELFLSMAGGDKRLEGIAAKAEEKLKKL
jgi:tetratricopeptide (TPR) repeat protein